MTDFDFETEEKTAKEIEEELVAKYRHVFLSSPMGIEVLGDILELCHFGQALDATNEAQIGEHHIGILILGRCGIFDQGTLISVVQALASVTPGE